MAIPKPPKKQLNLAQGALTKNPRNRSAAEKRAVRLTKPWRMQQKRTGGGGGGGGGGAVPRPPTIPAPVDPTAQFYQQPMSPADLEAEAGRLAGAQIQPSMQEIARMQEQAIREAQQQANLAGGLAGALGPMTANIGPQIQQQYQQAAETQGQLAQGFSAGLQGIAEQEAAANAALLENVAGAPAAQIENVEQASQGAADPLYGTGGFIPATAMGREGAAMAAYGSTMPAVVARMGQQDAASAQYLGQQQSGDLARQGADLQAQLPGMTATIRNDLIGREQAKFEANRQFKFAKDQFEFTKTQTLREFKLQLTAAKAAAKAAGVVDKKWLAEFDLESRKAEADIKNMDFQQWATGQGLEIDWAQLEQDAADKAGGDKSKRSDKREAAVTDVTKSLRGGAKDIIVWKTDLAGNKIRDRGKTPPYAEAARRLRVAYADEIKRLKRLGVSQKRINQLVRGALVGAGWKAPTPAALQPVRPSVLSGGGGGLFG